jgi:hypothetical protein
MIVRNQELRLSFNKVMEKMIAFTEINPSQLLRQKIQQQALLQKNYQRKHQVMQLEDFDFTMEQIAQDFDFVFEEYGFDKNIESQAIE